MLRGEVGKESWMYIERKVGEKVGDSVEFEPGLVDAMEYPTDEGSKSTACRMLGRRVVRVAERTVVSPFPISVRVEKTDRHKHLRRGDCSHIQCASF